MNPTTTILSLVAAALAGVTIVTFNDADLAKQEVTKAKEESLSAIRASGAKVAAAERKTFEAELRTKAALAGEAAAKDAAKATVDSTKKTSDDLAQALADLKKGAQYSVGQFQPDFAGHPARSLAQCPKPHPNSNHHQKQGQRLTPFANHGGRYQLFQEGGTTREQGINQRQGKQ